MNKNFQRIMMFLSISAVVILLVQVAKPEKKDTSDFPALEKKVLTTLEAAFKKHCPERFFDRKKRDIDIFRNCLGQVQAWMFGRSAGVFFSNPYEGNPIVLNITSRCGDRGDCPHFRFDVYSNKVKLHLVVTVDGRRVVRKLGQTRDGYFNRGKTALEAMRFRYCENKICRGKLQGYDALVAKIPEILEAYAQSLRSSL
ncbi:MAG: hypothetical protein OXR68_03545 [Alphaproteobacteria bacterium]|nr:hypothetical protein [Alphaproteobacteria bacterium]MDD9919681.1 hypothetical protein [Alphaproteobacteria bacterium]